ncbi:hypothetical protein O181_069281 [Austropuccinia psidii MF-1]|uniref:Uncharacterized protein n=1 Tax=Austropuccinia psidii MF-1 TaxID=1389203 RepID=A0A9Q3F379_9BASI|nr:hypothetical protein [Austropuccinia psidii MF-1]
MPYLDIEARGHIVGMCQEGLPFQAISELGGIPLFTVYDTITKFQCIGTVRTQKNRQTSNRDRMRPMRTQPHHHLRSLLNGHTDHQALTFMIQREIYKLGKHLHIAPKKPYLRPQDFQCCLAIGQ